MSVHEESVTDKSKLVYRIKYELQGFPLNGKKHTLTFVIWCDGAAFERELARIKSIEGVKLYKPVAFKKDQRCRS